MTHILNLVFTITHSQSYIAPQILQQASKFKDLQITRTSRFKYLVQDK
jgi:hypothetical protein